MSKQLMNLPVKSEPKFKITVRKNKALMPFHQEFSKSIPYRDAVLARLFARYSRDVIECRLLRGLQHGMPIRWRLEGRTLLVTKLYDKTAIGGKLTAAEEWRQRVGIDWSCDGMAV